MLNIDCWLWMCCAVKTDDNIIMSGHRGSGTASDSAASESSVLMPTGAAAAETSEDLPQVVTASC